MKTSLEAFLTATRLSRPDGVPHAIDHTYRGHMAYAEADMGAADAVTEFLALSVEDQHELRALMGASFNGLQMRLQGAGHWDKFVAGYEEAILARRDATERAASAQMTDELRAQREANELAPKKADVKADKDVAS